jgi:hypothetical protein
VGQKDRQKRERQKRQRKVKQQKKAAAIRAKYGPTRKPAPVTVKSVETGEVIETVDQSKFARTGFAESLERRAKDAGYANYAAYLRSKHWRTTRAAALERDGHKCKRCRSEKRLNVHHRYYAVLGAERLSSLETLCEDCHKKAHT